MFMLISMVLLVLLSGTLQVNLFTGGPECVTNYCLIKTPL